MKDQMTTPEIKPISSLEVNEILTYHDWEQPLIMCWFYFNRLLVRQNLKVFQ